jgi:hypothetical protein
VKQMRGFAGLLAYLVGVLAIVSVGVAGLMALQSPVEPTPSAPSVAAESHKVRLAKPVNQTIVDPKTASPEQKHKIAHVTRKRPHDAPTVAAGDAYGYASEPRRINPNVFPLFGLGAGRF